MKLDTNVPKCIIFNYAFLNLPKKHACGPPQIAFAPAAMARKSPFLKKACAKQSTFSQKAENAPPSNQDLLRACNLLFNKTCQQYVVFQDCLPKMGPYTALHTLEIYCHVRKRCYSIMHRKRLCGKVLFAILCIKEHCYEGLSNSAIRHVISESLKHLIIKENSPKVHPSWVCMKQYQIQAATV